MSKKDNFSQAMYEMFGLGKAPEPQDDELDDLGDLSQLKDLRTPADDFFDAPQAEASSAAQEPAIEAEAAEVEMSQPSFIEDARDPEPAPQAVEEPAPAAVDSAPAAQTDFFAGFKQNAPVKRANCTYFAEGTSMEGTLRSDSDIEIVGDFKGEIASDGKVTIHSNTTSSIAAAELVLIDCTLTGDSMIAGDVSVNELSSITGNVRANNLVCSGVIKGNLIVQGNIMLTENARIIGDIKTGTLTMARGAKVSGKIDMGG